MKANYNRIRGPHRRPDLPEDQRRAPHPHPFPSESKSSFDLKDVNELTGVGGIKKRASQGDWAAYAEAPRLEGEGCSCYHPVVS